MFKKLITLVMVGAVLSSCASQTIVRTPDSGVKIYIDGEFKGTGSVTHSDSKTSFSTSIVRMEKPGCREQTFQMPRGEEFQVGPFIGGLFLLVPFLWVSGYKPEHTYEFTCQK